MRVLRDEEDIPGPVAASDRAVQAVLAYRSAWARSVKAQARIHELDQVFYAAVERGATTGATVALLEHARREQAAAEEEMAHQLVEFQLAAEDVYRRAWENSRPHGPSACHALQMDDAGEEQAEIGRRVSDAMPDVADVSPGRTVEEYYAAFRKSSRGFPDDELREHALAVLAGWGQVFWDEAELGRATLGVLRVLKERGL